MQEERILEGIERLFTVPVYFIFGLFIPIQEWMTNGWLTLVGFEMGIIIFRGMPALLLFKPFLKHF